MSNDTTFGNFNYGAIRGCKSSEIYWTRLAGNKGSRVQQIYMESYYRSDYSRFMKYLDDVTGHPQRQIIEKRVEIIEFFEDYREEITRRAFGKGRSTIYLWKQKVAKAGGKISALTPGNRAPIHKRHHIIHPFIERFIIEYRTVHHEADKTTITLALRAACILNGVKPVSESTVGRIIHDLKVKGKIAESNKIIISGATGKLIVREPKPKKKKLRRKGFNPHRPGDLVQMDTVAVFVAGLKRYIFTAIDFNTRFAFAYAYATNSSTNGKISWVSFLM